MWLNVYAVKRRGKKKIRKETNNALSNFKQSNGKKEKSVSQTLNAPRNREMERLCNSNNSMVYVINDTTTNNNKQQITLL